MLFLAATLAFIGGVLDFVHKALTFFLSGLSAVYWFIREQVFLCEIRARRMHWKRKSSCLDSERGKQR